MSELFHTEEDSRKGRKGRGGKDFHSPRPPRESSSNAPAVFPRRRHTSHRSHAHSRKARREEGAKLGRRATEIVAWLQKHGSATDRRIMEGLGFGDMNAIRPRVSELLDGGLVVEVGATNDHVTGKVVRVVAVEKGGR